MSLGKEVVIQCNDFIAIDRVDVLMSPVNAIELLHDLLVRPQHVAKY